MIPKFKHKTPVKIGGEVKTIDWKNFKFRCYSLKDLIGGYYNKQDKPPLTAKQFEEIQTLEAKDKRTAKQAEKLKAYQAKVDEWTRKQDTVELETATISVLNKIWAEEVLKIKEVLKSKAVRRGVKNEDDSIKMVGQVFNANLSKNTKRFENKFLTGEPDLIVNESIVDIKTCESWATFEKKSLKSAADDYFWQLWGYLYLTGKKKAYIAYTLPSYDEQAIEYAKSSTINVDEENQTFLNMNFDRIPAIKRVKIAKVEIGDVDVKRIETYLQECRNYLQRKTERYNNFNPILG